MPRLSKTTGEPCAMKVCAVSRTDGIATRGGRSSGLMTPRRPPNLDPKGRGDKSMVGKRGAAEDVCAVVLQRLSDKAKTLSEKYQAASRLSIKRVIATYTNVSLVVGNSSSSLLNRRHGFHQAKVLSP